MHTCEKSPKIMKISKLWVSKIMKRNVCREMLTRSTRLETQKRKLDAKVAQLEDDLETLWVLVEHEKFHNF